MGKSNLLNQNRTVSSNDRTSNYLHGDVKILRHGTYVGFCRDPVVPPIASSISFRSSGEIRGCTAGVSKMNQNQQIDQIKPTPPV